MLGPVNGVTSTYSVCYSYNDDMYCIIVNDEEMMHFIVKKAQELMAQEPNEDGSLGKPVELIIKRKPRKKKLLNFWK